MGKHCDGVMAGDFAAVRDDFGRRVRKEAARRIEKHAGDSGARQRSH